MELLPKTVCGSVDKIISAVIRCLHREKKRFHTMTILLTREDRSRNTIAKWTHGTAVDVSDTDDTNEMLQRAGLNWWLTSSLTFYGRDKQVQSPHHTVYREDTGEFFYHAKERTFFQNEEVVESFKNFAWNAGLKKLNALGYLPTKKVLFAAAKIPFDMAPAVDPRDRSDCYLLMTEGHEVGRALRVGVYLVRLVCTNGQMVTLPVRQKKVVHRVAEFPKDLVEKYVQASMLALTEQKEKVDLLAKTKVSVRQAQNGLISYFQGEKARYEKKVVDETDFEVQACLRLFQGEAMGAHYESVKGTAYGLYHAVSEWENHHAREANGRKASSDVAHMHSLLADSKARKLAKLQNQLVQCVSL